MVRRIVKHIDRALKELYNLRIDYRAEDFLIDGPIPGAIHSRSGTLEGALYIRTEIEAGDSPDLSLGIYLSRNVRKRLKRYSRWTLPWATQELAAFSVAAEEISHFHYLLFNALRGRQLSQLELELQGEVDKFLLAFFSGATGEGFDALFHRMFEQFRLSEKLTEEQKSRYLEANHLAGRFIFKCAKNLSQTDKARALFLVRRFYSLDTGEKISFIRSSHTG